MSTSASSRPAGAKGASASRPARRSSSRDSQEDLVRAVPKAKVRRARLQLTKVDPWSVLKLAFLLSVALGIILVVATVGFYTLAELTGVFGKINDVLGTVLGTESGTYTVENLAPLSTVVSLATVVAVLNVILLTALGVVGALLYNVCASLVGGVGVTLADD
ncbi:MULTISPECIES: DUF3566 domain-containing protein [Micrococcus]|uniref:DUF3566 domain-containing protein n=1 Tax=Micrococcus TaxID=1269 RepID=UPI001CCFB6C3|nr:DUF3566 domain-containing protein [Micrococcus porci]MCG7422070.1 DUF3566 domain-containing protein [Micrococcus sp. ACRRV]UBH24966.1 DUF3566 domain-containing protein [Micrococcus porci]